MSGRQRKDGPRGRGRPARAPRAGARYGTRGGRNKTRRKAAREPERKPLRAEPLEADGQGLAAPGAELVRLNKFLADHGVASRRRCDELIGGGKVTVDGRIVTELGTKIDPEAQVVEIDGVLLRGHRRRYYLLNKPKGVVCTNEERELRPRAVDLILDPEKGRIYTVGRLDEKSEGLILLTNDGEFANRMMHPRYGMEKTYAVKVHGRIDDEALARIREGVHLSEGRTAGARIVVKKRGRDASQLEVTLQEGMNREIRRSFARVGSKVLELRRTRIGPLTDRGLRKPGRWRRLTRDEVRALLEWDPATEGRMQRHPAARGGARRAVAKRPVRRKKR